MVRQWISDVAVSVRVLTRAPGFTVVTTLTLGLAIGANAAIFSVVDGVLLSPLPYERAGELVSIRSSTPGNNTPPDFGVSPEFYVQYRDNASLLQSLTLYSSFGGTVRIGGEGQRVRGAEVTRSFFETLGVTRCSVASRPPPNSRAAPCRPSRARRAST